MDTNSIPLSQSKTDLFIEKANKKHSNKFDYSETVYVDQKTKVKIICPTHGVFLQSPLHHLRGNSCYFCNKKHKMTTEQFIEKAQLVHNNKFDYSETVYVSYNDKIKIKCLLHGIFLQKPNNHLNGKGCLQCARKLKTFTTSQFIEKASSIHNNKYDYSLVDYTKKQTKVKIICPIHGAFHQRPDTHLEGKGCVTCGGSVKLTIEQFKERSALIHGNKYDYSETVYVNQKIKAKIICPIHGEFYQFISSHLSGHGCSKCTNMARSNNEEFIKKAKKVHGERYDYSLIDYINNFTIAL
jgi:hypothetical protein